MAVAQQSQSQLLFVEETTYGVTPATPTMITLPRATGGFTEERALQEDNAIYADRQMRPAIHGNSTASGEIAGNFRKGDWDPFLESALQSTFTANVLKIGSTLKSFTIQDGQTDINQYLTTRGAIVNTMSMSLDINSDSPVSVTFGMTAKDLTIGQTDGASVITPASTNQPMNTFGASIGIADQGVAPADICMSSVEFTLDNQTEYGRCIGDRAPKEVIPGQVSITGSFTLYLRNETTYERFQNETLSAFEVPMNDPTGSNLYTFLFPNIKINSAETLVTAPSGARLLNCNFAAYYDTTEQSSLVITRTP